MPHFHDPPLYKKIRQSATGKAPLLLAKPSGFVLATMTQWPI
jgi:hypothetical protein